MSESMRIGLDDSAFRGRLRVRLQHGSTERASGNRPSARYFDEQVHKRPHAAKRAAEKAPVPIWQQSFAATPRVFSQPTTPAQLIDEATEEPASQPIATKSVSFAQPAAPRQQRSKVLKRQFGGRLPGISAVAPAYRKHRRNKVQAALIAMAVVVFLSGVAVSLQAFWTNRATTTQVSALSKKNDHPSSDFPSTTKPSSNAVNNYMVAPDLPRYIKIPKLGVNARVLQAGVTSSGALDSPKNVYDAAWYTGSAKPGQVGATLIDGHVSSWKTPGVFSGLKKLVAGDTIQIQRGDGQLLTYQVIKSQVYPEDSVDMRAAMTSVDANHPGLNLITCAGKVKPGTSEFNQRLVVFTKQI